MIYYGDQVKVTGGFYTGITGIVINQITDKTYVNEVYEIEFHTLQEQCYVQKTANIDLENLTVIQKRGE